MGVLPPHKVFIDSNIPYSRTLRDWIGLLYTTGDAPPFVVHWSEDVLADTIHHLRKEHPAWDGKMTSDVRDRIAATFEIGRVSDYVIYGTYEGQTRMARTFTRLPRPAVLTSS